MASFVEQVLRVDGPVTKKLKAAMRGPRAAETVLGLLAKQIDATRPPAWIVFTADGPLDQLVHLATPVFHATGADEDELFSGPRRTQVVFGPRGACTRVTPAGKTTDVKIAAKDLDQVTAFDAGGFLLADIGWVDPPPVGFAAFAALMRRAADAYTGDLSPYETAAAPATSSVATTTAGPGSCFLGAPARTGRFAAKAARRKPKLVWTSSYESNGGAEHGGCPVVADGLIFAGDSGFNAKYSATTLAGKTKWKVELTKGQSWIVGSAAVDRGVVYQATNQGLYALDAKTGKVRWMTKLSATAGHPLVLGDLVFIGSGDGLVGLALDTGRKAWAFAVKRDEYKHGVTGGVAYADGVLFFVAESRLFAVDVATGKKRWTAPAHGRATPSVDDTAVYTWSPAGLVAYERATGKERWHRKLDGLDWDMTIAVAADRVVTRAEGKVVALATKTGKVLWELRTKAPYAIGCASPVIAGDVVICVLVNDEPDLVSLHAADLATGKQLWKVEEFPLRKTESAALSWYCTPWVHDDGTIFVQAYGITALR